ncbi:MAG: 5'-methylthioadenosine nucleosidase [Planctomycetaceae bacterium]
MIGQKSGIDKARADIGVVCALPIELGSFLTRCQRTNHYKDRFVFRGGIYDDIRIAVVESGLGYARARQATLSLIETHAPKWILSCGFSGALQSTMQLGHIAVASSIVDQHGQELTLPRHFPAAPERGLFIGRLLTVDTMVRTVAEKESLAEQYNAIAVDMESLAVVQVAHEKQLDCMAIRTISDDMSVDLPPEILSILGETGTVRIGATLGSLVKRPGSLKDMMHLRQNAQTAAQSLATFLDGIVHQLPQA